MVDDLNYNAKITFEDGTSNLIFVNNLNNAKANLWEGWHCKAGVTAIYIYKNEVYSGECRNDRLGSLDQWELINEYTVCKQQRCFGCTTDMLQEKWKP